MSSHVGWRSSWRSSACVRQRITAVQNCTSYLALRLVWTLLSLVIITPVPRHDTPREERRSKSELSPSTSHSTVVRTSHHRLLGGAVLNLRLVLAFLV